MLRGVTQAAIVVEREEELLASGIEAAPRLIGDALVVRGEAQRDVELDACADIEAPHALPAEGMFRREIAARE